MRKVTVAGGCFWGVQHYFRQIQGITDTKVGYAQGNVINPSYEQVKTGLTQHVEAVELHYDESVITLNQIIECLFKVIDPTSLNKQGEDEGTQYRTGIYADNEEDVMIAQQFISNMQSNYDQPIVVEVQKLTAFYDAEEYHQDYLVKNPNGYCHIDFKKIMN